MEQRHMDVYRVASKNGLLFGGLFIAVVALVFMWVSLGWTFGLVTVNGKDGPAFPGDLFGLVFPLAAAAAGAYLVRKMLWLTAHEIRFAEDGSVTISAAIRHRQFPASELRSIERIAARITLEDQDARELILRSSQGTFRVAHFDRIEQLIERIRSANPSVEVLGFWQN
jgi:hypothetical protein